ncbi:MAG: phasin family protein [Kiloniellaceae bacterium]
MAKARAKTGNPFLDGDFGSFLDFNKFAEQFKLPGVDTGILIEAQKRNIEAVTAANRVAYEGAYAVVQRQAEFLRQAMEGASMALTELAKPGKPEDKWAKQAELVKEAHQLALANLRELADMSAKSNGEAAEVLNHRIAEGLDELKGAFARDAAAK